MEGVIIIPLLALSFVVPFYLVLLFCMLLDLFVFSKFFRGKYKLIYTPLYFLFIWLAVIARNFLVQKISLFSLWNMIDFSLSENNIVKFSKGLLAIKIGLILIPIIFIYIILIIVKKFSEAEFWTTAISSIKRTFVLAILILALFTLINTNYSVMNFLIKNNAKILVDSKIQADYFSLKAVQSQNPAFCSEIGSSYKQGIAILAKDACFKKIAESAGNVDICKKIESKYFQDNCIKSVNYKYNRLSPEDLLKDCESLGSDYVINACKKARGGQ